MSVHEHLQSRIDSTPTGGVLDLTGQTFYVDGGVVVNKRISIIGGLIVVSKPFTGTVVDVIWDRVVIDGLRVIGGGRTAEQMIGIRAGAQDVQLLRCTVMDIEYALYFLDFGSDGSSMFGCVGKQDAVNFPAPWNGLDYGVVTQHTSDILIQGCRITGTRHAVILGHGTRCSTVDACFLKNTANVQAVAMKPEYQGKPPAEDCRVVNCDILGGINLGGKRMTIIGNNSVGRLNHPQTSTALYAPDSTIDDYDHTIADNVFRTGTVMPGSKQYGAIYAYAGGFVGTPIFHHNRIIIEGDAPAVVGITGPLDVVPESAILDRGNVIQRV